MSLRKLPEIRAFQQSEALHFTPPETAVEAFDPNIRAAADDEENVISLYGKVGLDFFSEVDNSERRISAALRKIGKRDVVFNINSPGGNFFSGLAIYNLLRAHPAKVTVNVVAMAGSAASIIAMAGDELLMAEGSFLMVHNASATIIGNKHDASDAAELMADIDDAMAEVYASRAGVEKSVAAAWMDRRRGEGTMFNAAAAIQHRLADRKMGASAVKIAAEAQKEFKAVTVVERALMACGRSRDESRSIIGDVKGRPAVAGDPRQAVAGEKEADAAVLESIAALISDNTAIFKG